MVRAAEPLGGEDRTPIVPAVGGPTVLRILLGAQLRRLREARRITLEDAGKVIRAWVRRVARRVGQRSTIRIIWSRMLRASA